MVNIRSLLCFILIILCTKFFGALPSPINLVTLFVALAISFKFFFKKSTFGSILIVLLVGIVFNAISSKIFRDQSMSLTLLAAGNFFYLFLYFVFVKIDCSLRNCEKIIYYLGYIFSFCYIVQYIIYPHSIFEGADIDYQNEVRIRLTGQAIVFLAFFFAVNKILLTFQWRYAILIFFCFIVVFLMGFRTMMFFIIVITLFLMYKINKFDIKNILYCLLGIVFIFIIIQIPVIQEKLLAALSRQESGTFSNPEYVRVLNVNYFMQEHFASYWEMIWGSGMPNEQSEYGKYMVVIANRDGYIFQDMGLWGLSWVLGIIPVVTMIIYSIKAIRVKTIKNYKYLSAFFLFLLLSSLFTTMEFYRPGNYVVQAFVLYMISKYIKDSTYEKENRDINISQSK